MDGSALRDRAIASTRDGIVITDPRQPDNPIIYVNAAFERNTGYSKEDVLGKNPRILQGQGTSAASVAKLHDAVAEGAPCRVTLLNYKKDGTPFWNEVQISPVHDEAGALVNFVGVQRDVTESMRINEELERARAAADAANRAKTHFLASTSHEIRTALNGVVGTIELLHDSTLDNEQLDLVRTARRACDTLLSVIHDVLDIAKIESGKLELERIEFEPIACVMDTCRILAATARSKGLAVRVDVPPDAPKVVGDPARLRQILLNLGNNAVKFTERGEIVVRVAAEQSARKMTLSVSVADTGIGMTPEQSARLFQPFTQAEASIARTHGGSGLGLAICKQLVEAMDGRIEVMTAHGAGTTFTIVVPFDLPTNDSLRPVSTRAALARPGHPFRALIVDDNETNRLIARELLKKLGIDADVVCNGLEAVDAWVQRYYDIVLMDCQMPVMDGYDAAREIRTLEQARGGRRTPIVALTGQAFATDRERCVEAGMDGFVTKPITRDALGAALREHLLSTTPAPAPPESDEDDGNEPLVDRSRLREFSSGDESFEQRILTQFLSDAQGQMAAAEVAAAEHDCPRLLAALHALKGTAANVGARALSKTAARAEALVAASGCDGAAAERLARVRAALETFGAAIHKSA